MNWHGETTDDSILADVQAMIAALYANKKYGPYKLVLPLSYLNHCSTARLRQMLKEQDDVPLKNYVYGILLKRKRALHPLSNLI